MLMHIAYLRIPPYLIRRIVMRISKLKRRGLRKDTNSEVKR